MNKVPANQRRPINGLALFAGAMTAAVLTAGLAANIIFDRSLTTSVGAANGPTNPPTSSLIGPPAVESKDSAADALKNSALEKPDATRPATAFTPPPEGAMPDGKFGEMIRLGEHVFTNTSQYAAKYVGNSLNCASCHLDAGRRANSGPMWAAFGQYPSFRSKTGQVDTLAERIQGCFEYSMNGKAPPLDGDIMTALQAYAFWLAKGAPIGMALPGSGYPKLSRPAEPADYARGEKVYSQNCALCHGEDGQGQRGDGRQVFPPLWGPESFNWGAGMHQLENASGFIQANMPLGKGGSLSEQDAWDVAKYMNSHDRPQDPRFDGSVESTRQKYHDSDNSMYGRIFKGKVLGAQ